MSQWPAFPVTVVGSWPRPAWLLEALRQRQAGQLTFAAFNEVADRAVLEALQAQEEAGVDIVSDGEQRRDNFYSFVVEKLDGVQLMSLAEVMEHVENKAAYDRTLRQLDAPAFAIKNPTVVDRLRPRLPLALDEVEFLRRHTTRPIKVALPGPYLLARSMWVQGISDRVYPTQESLAEDLVAILRQEVVALRDAGVAFIQFDEPVLTQTVFKPDTQERTFMCASMAAASGNADQELRWATRLVNAIIRGVEGVKFGVHVCRGNWSRKEESLLSGSYEPLLMYLLIMQVDQLVLEFATPRAGELAVFAPYPRAREIGLGVVNPRTDEVETPEAIIARVEEALQYFAPHQIYLNPDCGFGTFAERPMNSPQVATEKLRRISQAARQLRATYAAAPIPA